MKRQTKRIRSRTVPPEDLTGMRFGKWTVLEYAGQKAYMYGGKRFTKRMWLCRCDCGTQKEIPHHNLTKGLSTQCQPCSRHGRGGVSDMKIYRAWDSLKRSDKLPKEWLSFDAFRKALGDPPDKKAILSRYDLTKPHSPQNTFWMHPGLVENDPNFLSSLKQLRKKLRRASARERVTQDEVLMRIRTATSMAERNRCIVAARKAGYSYVVIGTAANVTRQRAHIIATTYVVR